ncbi:MAG: hypothetical protein IPM77_03560 [Crocinitomicaceae bacterium]|nr:hypothetical protein [Crocinitomicaceae bacterium]
MSVVLLLLASSTDKTLADYCGLFFADTDAKGIVSYSVSIQNSETKSNLVTCNTNELSENAPLTDLSVSARPKLKQAYLNWEAVSLQKDYGAYWVEQSTDSIHFSKVNQYPYLFLKSADEPNKIYCDFADTSVQEGTVIYYRVSGINYFGETGKSSNTVKIYIPKSIYGEIHIDSVAVIGSERKIIGEFVSHRTKNDISKFVLLRSDSLAFGYRSVAESSVNSFDFSLSSDAGITSGDRYYYKVAAVGTDGDTVYSFPYYFFTLDQIPPAIPQDLKGTINDSGIVSISWKLNIENDIRGYRIFRSNSLKEEFVEVTREFAQNGFFSDTLSLRNLTPEVYYRISAVDLNYNNSKLSAPVLILKPDTIPPVPAVIFDYLITSAGLEIKWNNSTSADLKESKLIRSDNSKTDTLIVWKNELLSFTDTTCVNGKSYNYSILTSDVSDNNTSSELIRINYETGIRSGISELNGVTDRESKKIILTWKLPAEPVYSVQIYRALNDGEFALYKTLRESGTESFADTGVAMNNQYLYKVKIVYRSGVSSLFSKTITVVY